jgi:hypothetical protein
MTSIAFSVNYFFMSYRLRKFELSKKSESMQVSNQYHRPAYGLEAFGLGSGDTLTVFGYKVTFNIAMNNSGN